MSSNRLRLNQDKSQFSWFGTPHRLNQLDRPALGALSSSLISTEPVRNLGVTFDPELRMNSHITNLCRSCFFQIRRLRSIRCSITPKVLRTLVHAFICSRLDYCNSALYGSPAYSQHRLQSVLNAAARLILRIRKYDHISEAIRTELHWLPIHSRINFKICQLVRGCLSGSAPAYLQELCIPVGSIAGRRSLRSAANGDLIVPTLNGKPYRKERTGRRAFAFIGPTLWNKLPLDIRQLIHSPEQFSKKLKTFLFSHQL